MCLSKTFPGTFEGLQDRLVAWNANHAHLEYETPFKKIVLEDSWKSFSPHCSNGVMHVTGAWQSALQLFTLNLEPQAKVNPPVMNHDVPPVMNHDYCWRNCERPLRIRQARVPAGCHSCLVPLSLFWPDLFVEGMDKCLLWSLTRHDWSGFGQGRRKSRTVVA